MNAKSKKSIAPHWSPETYTKIFAPLYDNLTTLSGWRGQLRRQGLTDLPVGKLLDVGCGTGYFLNMARDLGYEPHGVEPSAGMAEKAKELFGFDEKVIHQTTGCQIPYPDASFDVVTANGSLVHVLEIEPTAREIARVLKKGGILRVIDHAIPIEKTLTYPFVYLFSQGSGDIIHDYEAVFADGFTLQGRKTLGRGGYLQRFDFKRI